MQEAIKQTLNTTGWAYIEEMLREEIVAGRSTKSIKTEGVEDRIVARQVEAANMAGQMVEKVLKKLDRMRTAEVVKKEVYR